jgi:hypothetical protein
MLAATFSGVNLGQTSPKGDVCFVGGALGDMHIGTHLLRLDGLP